MLTFAPKAQSKVFSPVKAKKNTPAKPGHSAKIRSLLRRIIDNREISQLVSGADTVTPHQQATSANNQVDPYEQEADRVADHVMHSPSSKEAEKGTSIAYDRDEMPENTVLQAKGISNGSCSSAANIDDDDESGQMIQKKAQPGTEQQPGPQVATQLSQSSNGDKLPGGLRKEMEGRFGHSFRQVRIHTDAQAVQMTRQLNAEAFATGNHIYLNAGRYNPDSFSGRWLLAHELTHVLQQRQGTNKQVGSMPISNVGTLALQRYKLKGFPAAKAAQMHTAIATAIATVNGCSYLTWLGKLLIRTALRRMRYDYVPDLGLCGWTFPASWYIEIGKEAFNHSKCCDLASTLAHEASHTEWYTEGRARKMECKCFGCSC